MADLCVIIIKLPIQLKSNISLKDNNHHRRRDVNNKQKSHSLQFINSPKPNYRQFIFPS